MSYRVLSANQDVSDISYGALAAGAVVLFVAI